jgi:homoserine dehydrogenase
VSAVSIEGLTKDKPALVRSPRRIRAVLLGYGRIGQAVASLADDARDRLGEAGIDLRVVCALVRDTAKRRAGPRVTVVTSVEAALASADVVIEALGGVEPARTLIESALRAGVPVVTANKSLLAAHGPSLRATARASGAAFLYDAAVIAGVPFVGNLTRRPFAATAAHIEGILNGTSHYILTRMAAGQTYAAALHEATAHGLAEPDPSADISGRDAAEKLAILLQLCARWDGAAGDLTRVGLDALQPQDFAAAAQLFGTIKPVAIANVTAAGGGAYVGPAFVARTHPFSRLDGVTNVLSLVGPLGHRTTFAGPGAGPAVTAITMLDDVIEALAMRGRPERAPAQGLPAPAGLQLCAPPATAWLFRLRDSASHGGPGIERLFPRPLRPARIVAIDDFIYVRTNDAPWAAVQQTVAGLRARGLSPFVIPALADAGSVNV